MTATGHPPSQGPGHRREEGRIYDLSPMISPELPVWPGDTPFRSRLTWKMGDGSPVNVSSLTTTSHLGSHADAPFHTEARGATIEALPLTPFVGPCRVVAVPGTLVLEPHHLPPVAAHDPPRVLFKTSLVGGSTFPREFATLSGALARELAARGTLLVGLDSPSVDPLESKTLDAHHALLGSGVVILEGLVLDSVPPGLYELIALPLKMKGLDASPVRAILRS